ncbi:hypothetical protein [Nonomuraea salmonea]|uniref:hypothetical protein n=1 Tax=Nonomuraea salmonea TaxID=46181 RepID=UPI003CD08F43
MPLRRLFDAGGADRAGRRRPPLLFGTRLLRQYELAREVYGFSDAEVAELARQSVRSSSAPESVRKELLKGVDDWLAGSPE